MSTFLLSILLLLLLPHITSSTQACKTRYCGNPEVGPSIQHPFYLRGANESGCGHSGFEVFCNDRNQTIFTLPKGGDLLVKRISLEQRKLWVNDPQDCLLARFVHDIDFLGSPFRWSSIYLDPVNLNFLNCTTTNWTDSFPAITHKIPCLNSTDNNHSVVAVLTDPFATPPPTDPSCLFISSNVVPVNLSKPDDEFWSNFYSDLELEWNRPDCRKCDPLCGSFTDWDDCYKFNVPNPGGNTPKNGNLDKILGLGIAGVVCFVVAGLTHLLGVKVGPNGGRRSGRERDHNTTETNMEEAELVDHDNHIVRTGAWEGLDGSTIEEFPKMQVGESGRLPKAGDNVCSICLCEYEPMDTLRTIPHCNHYFHAHCIDGWLKMNAACPLCRNLPTSSSSPLNLIHSTSDLHH